MKKTKIVLATVITVVIVATIAVSFAAWDVLSGAVEGFDAVISKNVEIKIVENSFKNFKEAAGGKKLLPEGAIKGVKDTEIYSDAAFDMRYKNSDKKNVTIYYDIAVIIDGIDCSEYFAFTVSSPTLGISAVSDTPSNMISGKLTLTDDFTITSDEGELISMNMSMKFKDKAEDFNENTSLGINSIIGRDFKLRITVEAR